ncbi:hypothetical protein GGI08_003318 [Coemansia sp. S2]|nr:hypothetical protein GGI08_003318 [Coemansia sp. S2]KAJ2345579.1 hypothetical protein GGH92_003984 [Coemansia sp. RSA 2673]
MLKKWLGQRSKTITEASAAKDISHTASVPDDVFDNLDFSLFNSKEVLEGGCDIAALLGYLLGESEKALETMVVIEERSTNTASGLA